MNKSLTFHVRRFTPPPHQLIFGNRRLVGHYFLHVKWQKWRSWVYLLTGISISDINTLTPQSPSSVSSISPLFSYFRQSLLKKTRKKPNYVTEWYNAYSSQHLPAFVCMHAYPAAHFMTLKDRLAVLLLRRSEAARAFCVCTRQKLLKRALLIVSKGSQNNHHELKSSRS